MILPRRYLASNILNSVEKYSQFFPSVFDIHKKKFSNSNNVLPQSIRVVICGGGVMGASVAYHLAVLGWGHETVLIEKNRFVYNLFLLVGICQILL